MKTTSENNAIETLVEMIKEKSTRFKVRKVSEHGTVYLEYPRYTNPDDNIGEEPLLLCVNPYFSEGRLAVDEDSLYGRTAVLVSEVPLDGILESYPGESQYGISTRKVIRAAADVDGLLLLVRPYGS